VTAFLGSKTMTESHPQRVIVTGAAGVMGTWISQAFAREGADLLLTDTRPEGLERLGNELRDGGAGVTTVVADVSRDADVERLIGSISRRWNSPDVLVNNAGIYPHAPVLDTTVADVRSMFEVNVLAPFALSRAVATLMVAAGVAGSIVNIGSGAGEAPATGGAPYAASKAALHMLTRAFAIELAPMGIRVNTVQPGFAPGSEVSELDEAYIARMTSTIPLGRTSGPADAPEAVLFLSSPRASFITGASLAVDGGRTAGTMRPMPLRTMGGRS